MSRPLAVIVSEMNAVVASIIEAGGELSPETELLLNNVQRDLAVKCDDYSLLMDRLEAEEFFWQTRAEHLNRIAKSCASLREKLKLRIKESMAAMNTEEVRGDEIRFKLVPSNPRLIIDELTLQTEYQMIITSHVPDKTRIRKDLEAGVKIRGAALEDVHSLRKYFNKK